MWILALFVGFWLTIEFFVLLTFGIDEESWLHWLCD